MSAATAGQAAPEPPMLTLYREALERLADLDTPVLGEGLGGCAREELHVRASFAAHTLGRNTCRCHDCLVSLELDPWDYPAHPDDCVCPGCQAVRDEDDYQREQAEEGSRVGLLDSERAAYDEADHHGDEDDR